MGYTNKTSHYELPQYVANDKPSWLGDFNAAMLKIDTAMADNDATAEAANSAATGAQTQVAALSSQLSTIQGQVNTAVDTATTADGKATTAQTVAGEANTNASEAKTLAGEAKALAQVAKQTADNALPIGGGTMTGDLILNGAPTADNQAATKAYVDSKASGGVEPVTVEFTANVSEGTTNRRVIVNKQGGVYGFVVANVIGNANTAISTFYTDAYPVFKVAGDPFKISDSALGNYQNCRVGVSTTTDNLGLYAHSRDGYTEFFIVKSGGGTFKLTGIQFTMVASSNS